MAAKINNGNSNAFSRLWSISEKPECVVKLESPPTKLPSEFQLGKRGVWKRTLGYDDTEIMPLPELPVTNFYMSPAFIPEGMSTEPIHYPNLITGVQRSPQHAARTALNVRYTDFEWRRGCSALCTEAKRTKMNCEKVRADAIRLMRETDEKIVNGQTDVKYRIEERIKDMLFWKNELNTELEKVRDEANLLADIKTNIARSMQDLETPLHIAQECLRHREGRRGIQKQRDLVEESLLQEVDNLGNSRRKFEELYSTIDQQLNKLRNAQRTLEEDVVHKEQTLCIDRICKDLDNYSRGIAYRGGIEKTANATTTAESWSVTSARRVENSQTTRAKSAELRSSLGTLMTAIATSVQEHSAETNWAFERDQVKLANEITKVQDHMNNVKEEKFQLDKYVYLLKKAIEDKSTPLMVSQTRLDARCHRQGLELCDDFAHRHLIKEIFDVQDTIEKLYLKLQDAESKYGQLLKTRNNLEEDLKRKINNLFTDREKCMSLRRSFPITKMFKH